MQEINDLFLLHRDYFIVWTTVMQNEPFMIGIYVFLFALGLQDDSMNTKDLSNL